MEVTSAYLGQGITFPFNLTNGAINLDGFEALIESSLKMICAWEYGTHFFNPTFGARIWELQGEPNDTVLATLVKRFLLDAINSWEGRISLLEVAVSRPKAYSINITCKYIINATSKVTDYNFQYSV